MNAASGDLSAGGGRRVKTAQNTVSRGWCHGCSRGDIFIRSDGRIGEHRLFYFDARPSTLCDASGERKRQ